MRAILITAVIVAIVIAAAVFLQQDAGLVRAEFMGASYDGPLAIVALVALVGFIGLYLIVRLLGWLFNAPRRFGQIMTRRQQDASLNRLVDGTVDLAEGRFARAERVLIKDMPAGPQATLHYISAAHAANARGDQAQRDAYIDKAVTDSPAASKALRLTQAGIQLESDDHEGALATLEEIGANDPRNLVAQRLRARALQRAGQHDQLLDMLGDLRKHEVLPAAELSDIEAETAAATFAKCEDAATTKIWKSLPASTRDNPKAIAAYAQRLIALNDMGTAERVIGDNLNRHLDDNLIALYGNLSGADSARQLSRVESLLKSNENNATLLTAAGTLCLRQELWGKAKSYLEQSAALADSPAAQQGLADVARQNGDTENAIAHLSRGLALALA